MNKIYDSIEYCLQQFPNEKDLFVAVKQDGSTWAIGLGTDPVVGESFQLLRVCNHMNPAAIIYGLFFTTPIQSMEQMDEGGWMCQTLNSKYFICRIP
jgi:hypothetical protein